MAQVKDDVGLSFDDVLLVPHKGKVKSRDDVSLRTHLGGPYWLTNPIVASPMSTVCDSVLARRLSELGGIGIIHRFMTVEDQVEHYKLATKSSGPDSDMYKPPTHWAGCAVGVSEGPSKKKEAGSLKRTESLFAAGCRFFAIDIAHGHSGAVETYFQRLDSAIYHESTFISGSVATADGARFSIESGCEIIRVGIGNGSACSTRETTGHGIPQLTALLEISEEIKDDKARNNLPIRIISCGGIRNGGDAVKALASGASTIMLGQYLAGCDEAPSPGVYYGMASKDAKQSDEKYVEGASGNVNLSGTLEKTLQPLLDGIRSGISYSGARTIKELHEKAEFIKVAPGVENESKVRLEL